MINEDKNFITWVNELSLDELYDEFMNCRTTSYGTIECDDKQYFSTLINAIKYPKWHKVSEDDLPKEGGNYWCKLKGDYQQGSSHYKQHCKDGYCILQWLNKAQKWNVKYNTEVEAWIELPK